MRRWLATLSGWGFLAVQWFGFALIALASREYFDFETLPPFVVEKLPLRFEALWLVSLRVHVASALLCFPLCLLLMTRFLQRRHIWHRWVGRVTGAGVLLALVPSGVVLAFDAKDGTFVAAGFLLSAVIVAVCMSYGIASARRRDLLAHRRAMLHVVAQMSVAVSSRLLIVGLDALGMSPEVAYVVALWVPVIGSLTVAELLSTRPRLLRSYVARITERSTREFSPFALLVRARAFARSVPRLGR